MDNQIDVLVKNRQEELVELSKQIWSLAETALEEKESSQLLSSYLETHGFSVERGLAGMDTAFLAQWGSGSPRILYLAEYDALSLLGQDAVPYESPIAGKNGHACGHNLLGVGAVGAAMALRDYLQISGTPGTVALMGCPAEEIMVGKIKLAEAGFFKDYDLALTWHPDAVNLVSEYRYQAMYSMRFSFYGKPSHAAVSPEAGRSALDAVELMNVGANYLREHIDPGARIHYVIQHGGEKPNIVPAYAQSWYYIRAPRDEIADDIFNRVCDIAQGAALMTGTKVERQVLSYCPATRINHALNDLLKEAFDVVGAPQWDEADLAFAKKIQEQFPAEQVLSQLEAYPRLCQNKACPLDTGISALTGRPFAHPASSDVSKVSTIIPTGQIMVACYPIGAAGHTWPITACAGMQIGWSGMVTAAKVLALAGRRICEDPSLLNDIRAEF